MKKSEITFGQINMIFEQRIQTRQVYSWPWVVKLVTAIRKQFMAKNDFDEQKNQNTHNLCLLMLAKHFLGLPRQILIISQELRVTLDLSKGFGKIESTEESHLIGGRG